MSITVQSSWIRFRIFMTVVVVGVFGATFLTAEVSSAAAAEQANPVVGSFGIGGGVLGGVDERTGVFDFGVPIVVLPGLGGAGSVDVGVSYDQGLAVGGVDRFGLGAGVGWSGSFVDVDGGVRVFPASGGVFDADASKPSGLDRYMLGDLVFTQERGTLEARDGVGVVEYAYSLVYTGGVTDYFNTAGDIVARVDVFGARVDWLWEAGGSHRLMGVVDGAGSRVTMVWTGAGVEVVAPLRSDGVQAKTVLEVTGSHLVSVTDARGERMVFGYQDNGLVDQVRSGLGAVTTVSYQVLPDASKAVDRVVVVDSATGTELSVRQWGVVGERAPSGWPTYAGAGVLWASGDGEFRYRTQLSDGATRVVSEYNSLGLMVNRKMVVSVGAGDVVVQEQKFVFPGTQTGGIPDPQLLPKQYQKPTHTTVVFRDSAGATHEVSEQTIFDETGRLTQQISANGAVTETVYDTEVPVGMLLPVGVMLEQTTTGADGMVSKMVNTPTPDRKTIAATETFVGPSVHALASHSRTEMVVQPDGFVSEEKIIATGNPGAGPGTVVTRFDRTVDNTTVTVSTTTAAGTPAQSTGSTVVDKATGLPVSTQDATGRVATMSYDTAGRVVAEKDAAGLATVTEYGNKVTRVTNPMGVMRNEYVDVLGQVVKITDNINNSVPQPGFERIVQTRVYEQNSSKVITTDVRGLETTTVSDVFGRVREVVTPNGVRQVSEYDDIANTVSTGLVDGTGGLTGSPWVLMATKDDTNKIVKETGTREDGVQVPESQTRYDGLGRPTEQVSQDLSTSVILNPDGTPKTTTLSPLKPQEFAGQPVTGVREYNVLGVSTKKTLTQVSGDARSGVSRVLDAAGRTVTETNQAGQTTEFEYTVDGLAAETRDNATGVVTRNTYDSNTRALTLTETVTPDGVVSQTGFEYDPKTGNTVAVFNPIDRVGTQITYAYDIFENVTQITYPDGKTIHHSFDEHGRQTSSTDITGNVTVYEYDRYGLLTRATQTTPDNTVLATVGYVYDRFGRMTQLTRGNDVTTRYTFTSANEITTETTTRGDTVIRDASYEYDTHGNLTKRVDTWQESRTLQDNPNLAQTTPTQDTPGQGVGEKITTPGPVTETTLYTYDAYNRLTESRLYDGTETVEEPRQHTEYQITVSGDVAQETVTTRGATGASATVSVRDFEYNVLGQMVAVVKDGVRTEQEYDRAGNLTLSADGTRYTYNVHNQPVTETLPGGSIIQNTYWATGQRHTTNTTQGAGDPNVATETVGMYWDDATLINETHTTPPTSSSEPSTVTVSYLIGASRHSRTLTPDGDTTSQSTDYYIKDRHGNTTALTGNTGQVTTAYTYTDYGQTTTNPSNTESGRNSVGAVHPNAFQYAGEYTTETGTQYLGNRIYDPQMMRFTTQDIAELYNLYAYANANPITMVDPTGETPDWDIITDGIIAAANLLLTTISLALTAVSFGASLTLFGIGIAIVGLVDLGITISHTIDTFGPDFITDKNFDILGWTTVATAGAGIADAAATIGKRIAQTATKKTLLRQGSTQANALRDEAANADILAKDTVAKAEKYRTKASDYDTKVASEATNPDNQIRWQDKANRNRAKAVNADSQVVQYRDQATRYRTTAATIDDKVLTAPTKLASYRRNLYSAGGIGALGVASVVTEISEFAMEESTPPESGSEITTQKF